MTTGFANLSDGAKVIVGKDDQTPTADLAPRKKAAAGTPGQGRPGQGWQNKDGQAKDEGEHRGKKGEGDQKAGRSRAGRRTVGRRSEVAAMTATIALMSDFASVSA